MTDREMPAAPGRLTQLQDQLPDFKINYGQPVHSGVSAQLHGLAPTGRDQRLWTGMCVTGAVGLARSSS